MSANDVAYLDTMFEVLGLVVTFAEKAQDAEDDVTMGTYLRLSSRSLRCALEIYRDRLAQNRAEIEQGEKSGSKVQSDADPDGGRIHGSGSSSWGA